MEEKIIKASVTYSSDLNFQELDEYTALFAKCQSPSKTKGAVVMDVITSLPNFNKNGMAFTANVLRNSSQSMISCPLDYQHEQPIILGHVVDSKVIDLDSDMAVLRTAAITYKKRLADYGVESLSNMKYSMECLQSDYAFYTVSKGIIEKDNAPAAWIENLDTWKSTPIYDSENNDRVILLIGGSDGTVEFIGIGITDRPADTTAYTLLQVAHEKGGNELDTFTQEQLDQKLNELKEQMASEYVTKIDEAKVASASEKDLEWQAKYDELKASFDEMKNRAELAEGTLGEIKAKELVAKRKQCLAEANYPEQLVDKKAEFIASATDTDFDAFVAEFKELTAAIKPVATVVANDKQAKTVVASVSVTDGDDDAIKVSLEDLL